MPHGNDNGPVTLAMRSGTHLVGTIESHYNYDFFADQPAGWLRHTWVDGDWQRGSPDRHRGHARLCLYQQPRWQIALGYHGRVKWRQRLLRRET